MFNLGSLIQPGIRMAALLGKQNVQLLVSTLYIYAVQMAGTYRQVENLKLMYDL